MEKVVAVLLQITRLFKPTDNFELEFGQEELFMKLKVLRDFGVSSHPDLCSPLITLTTGLKDNFPSFKGEVDLQVTLNEKTLFLSVLSNFASCGVLSDSSQ